MPEILTILLAICRPAVLVRWLILLAAIAAAWVMLNYSKVQAYFTARDKRNQTREAVANLKKQKEELERDQASLQQQGFAAEKAVRERLMMVKPGEKVIIVETPTTTPGEPGASPQPVLDDLAATVTQPTSDAGLDTAEAPTTRTHKVKKSEKPTSATASTRRSKPKADAGDKEPSSGKSTAKSGAKPAATPHGRTAAQDATAEGETTSRPVEKTTSRKSTRQPRHAASAETAKSATADHPRQSTDH